MTKISIPFAIVPQRGLIFLEVQNKFHLSRYVLYCFCVPVLQDLRINSEASFEIPWSDKRSPISGEQEVLASCEMAVFPEAVLVERVSWSS